MNHKTNPPRTLPAKKPTDSEVTMTELVLPQHTNAIGTVFGGTVMSWIDIAAAIVAFRHARQRVVTASIDALNFKAPIHLGDVVQLSARINYVSRTSMEIGVKVESEDPHTGEKSHTVSAYTTFVAIDEKGIPTAVPPLLPETAEEIRRFEEAKKRKESRLALAKAIKVSRGN